MTCARAKEILAVYRPGTSDESDPIFAEALALAKTDPELKRWFESSLAFDRGLRTELGQVPTPANLRDQILAHRKIVRPSPAHWYQRKLNGRELATAAVLLLTLTLAGFWVTKKPVAFADFQRQIADQSWGGIPHVELKGSDLDSVKKMIAAQNLGTNFAIPPTLARSDVQGCTILRWQDRRIPMLCFNSKGQHLHLMVVDRRLFPDAPTAIPQAEHWDAWRTVSWSIDDHTYVLTGLSTPAFVKKFRRGGRWDWES
jgi:hypothetical protein